jgi:hypothetical protein
LAVRLSTTEGALLSIYRNAHRGLDIVTFDELLKKGYLLLEAITD